MVYVKSKGLCDSWFLSPVVVVVAGVFAVTFYVCISASHHDPRLHIIIHLLVQHVPFSRMHKKPISSVCVRESVSVRIKMILQPNRRITSITLLHYYSISVWKLLPHTLSHSFAVSPVRARADVWVRRMNKKYECECECVVWILRELTLIVFVYRRIQHQHQRRFPFTFVARFSVLRNPTHRWWSPSGTQNISSSLHSYMFTVHTFSVQLITHAILFAHTHTQFYLPFVSVFDSENGIFWNWSLFDLHAYGLFLRDEEKFSLFSIRGTLGSR